LRKISEELALWFSGVWWRNLLRHLIVIPNDPKGKLDLISFDRIVLSGTIVLTYFFNENG
jgi:hypothetical protein